MDMSQYRDLFISEAREYLRGISGLIVDLEKDSGDRDKIDALFRAAHSIKGMAASMDYRQISELAHKLEDLMARVRKGSIPFDRGVADLLLEGGDLIEAMIADVEAGVTNARDLDELFARIVAHEPGAAAAPPAETVEEPPAMPPQEPPQPEPPRTPAQEERRKGESPQTVRVKTALLDRLINLTGELITNKQRLTNLCKEAGRPALNDAVTELTRLLRGLHNEVMNVRLMPLAAITDRFPRIIRDLARKEGKEVDFVIDGKEIELDRGILEELSDPLIHILRNAVDHGMESPQARQAAGKPLQGTVTLRARRDKDQVIIAVEDDGRGMDPARIVAAAVEKGFVTAAAGSQLTPGEALLLTCLPGFSTAGAVTDVSGRGVGMDAVRSTIQSLCGTLSIESEPGKGTRIILKLPPTVAIINVLLMSIGGLTVAVPVNNIIRTLDLHREQLTDNGARHSFALDDEEVPLLDVNRIFGLPPAPEAADALPVFISEVKGRRVALRVDAFLGHQEVFIKPLGRPLDRMHGLAGGAILGGGEVVFILDVANIL
jgi:two-component system chemotaxis sensor kinase CheA